MIKNINSKGYGIFKYPQLCESCSKFHLRKKVPLQTKKVVFNTQHLGPNQVGMNKLQKCNLSYAIISVFA